MFEEKEISWQQVLLNCSVTPGICFITPDDGSDDLFAHFSAINMGGFKTLKDGQKITFEVTQGPKGKQAADIQVI